MMTGSAKGTTGTPGIDYATFSSDTTWSSGIFTISPYTMAILTATATVNFSVIDDHQIPSLYSDAELGSAGAGLYGSSIGYAVSNEYNNWIATYHGIGTGDSFSESSRSDQVIDPTTNKYRPVNSSTSRTLVASFLNNNPIELYSYFGANITIYGHSYAPVVPEPESYAMMLTGLLAVGIGARRERRVVKSNHFHRPPSTTGSTEGNAGR